MAHRSRAGPAADVRRGGDGGFSLIELSVALMLSSMLLVAFAGTVGSSLDASRGTRYRQNATTMAMERIEIARNMRWEYLGSPSVDAGAPLTDGVNLLASETGLPADEELVVCDAGELDSQVMESLDGVTYTTWTYVTELDPSLRRVVVLVEWDEQGVPLTYRSDTLVSSISAGRAITDFRPMFPEAAILGVDDVLLHPGSTVSEPASAHSASVLTNGDFGDGSAVIDGDVLAGATAIVDPSNVAGTVEQNAGSPVEPPTAAEIEAWRSGLIADAQAGVALSGNQTFAGATISAPMYVDGSVVFEGAVTIAGSGPIYATGSIKLQGGAVVAADSTVLASATLVEFSGGSEFRVADPSYAGVVSFGSSATALNLTGGSSGTVQGVAYAPYGGISLSGTAAWHGSLVAHGATTGRVDLSGGSSVTYPANMLPTSAMLAGLRPETTSIPGGC